MRQITPRASPSARIPRPTAESCRMELPTLGVRLEVNARDMSWFAVPRLDGV
jgi:hypothetical protein